MKKKTFKITALLVCAGMGVCEKMVPTLPEDSPTSGLLTWESECTLSKKNLTVGIFSDSTK
ncbi:MAG: hypothetical protein HQ579_05085 [Candidatus Omnitrophica bacterium]|nr:hypothetical protein [Candidatus Omnitrophota bacterium]